MGQIGEPSVDVPVRVPDPRVVPVKEPEPPKREKVPVREPEKVPA